MGIIHLENMEFYAYHGCFEEEAIVGNHFVVNLWMETDTRKPSETDNINDALNYQQAYLLVKKQMEIRSHLLENVCKRIIDELFATFPQLSEAKVRVSKQHPPMGGPMKGVSVELLRKR
jgi:7,8-dihydroneopterin aldolase/epimerase/oxygenase